MWGHRQVARNAYLPHIDGLRAIAVSGVVAYHAFPDWLPGGFIGVDVFFVISGFLITRLIADEMTRGEFSLLGFYERRVRRLLPAATVVLAVTTVLSALILLPDAFREFGKSLTAAAIFLSNIYFRKNVGYFDGPAEEKPLLHTWSLAVEEQFYLIWPFILLMALPRASRKTLMLGIGLLIFASLAYAQNLLTRSPDAAFYLLPARFWELGVGGLLAVSLPHLRRPDPIIREFAGAFGAVTIILSMLLINSTTPFPGLSVLPACLGTLAIIWSGTDTDRQPASARLFSTKPMVFVGLISYSLYLWHWPLISLAKYHAQRQLTSIELLVLVLIAVLAAIVSWRYIEQPFRRRPSPGSTPRQTLSSRDLLKRGALTIIATAVVGLTIDYGRGWPWRLDNDTREIFAQMSQANDRRPNCDGYENAFRNDDTCTLGPRRSGRGFELVLLGDSNADHFAALAENISVERNLPGRQVTNTACAPLIGMSLIYRKPRYKRACIEYQRTLADWIKQNPNLKLAILSANWVTYPFESADRRTVEPNGLPLHPDTDQTASELGIKPTDTRYYLISTVLQLKETGAKVHLIGQVPHLFNHGGLPLRCLANAVANKTSTEACGVPAKGARDPLKPSNAFLNQLANHIDGVTAAVPSDVLCDEKRCSVMRNGVFLYRDPGHINAPGARYLASKLTQPPPTD